LQSIPSSIDWVAKGAVNAIKDQGTCGSCYTFSGAAALEALNFIKNGKLVSFSEQALIDCSNTKTYGN